MTAICVFRDIICEILRNFKNFDTSVSERDKIKFSPLSFSRAFFPSYLASAFKGYFLYNRSGDSLECVANEGKSNRPPMVLRMDLNVRELVITGLLFPDITIVTLSRINSERNLRSKEV